MSFHRIFLDIIGVIVVVETESELVSSWIRFDFARFLPPESEKILEDLINVRVRISSDEVRLPSTPSLVETSRGAGFVSFDDGEMRYVLYEGKVLAKFNRAEESVVFSGDAPELLYEKVFLFILSRAGELLESKGLHRVHGLGVSINGRGILYLMPMGGGKSTLALDMLNDSNVSLISDDTPLIDYRGNVIPFPLRIGGTSESSKIPPELKRVFTRSNRSPKVVLHPDAIKDRWETSPVPCKLVIIGRWTTGSEVSVKAIKSLSLFKKLFRDCVLGYGVAQVVEFFLQSTLKDIFNKTILVSKRLLAISALVARAKGYEILVPCNPPQSIAKEIIKLTLKES